MITISKDLDDPETFLERRDTKRLGFPENRFVKGSWCPRVILAGTVPSL